MPLDSLRRLIGRYPGSFHVSIGVALAYFTCMNLLTAPLPLYVAKLGGQALAVGLVMGLFSGAALMLRLPVGWAADRSYRWWLILAACAVQAIASAGYLFFHSVPTLLAVRTFHGMSIALFSTGYTALAADLSPADRRGEALGLAGVAGPLTMLFAPALGDWVRLTFGFQAAFALALVVALATLGLLTFLPRQCGQPPHAAILPRPSQLFGGVSFTIVLAMALCGSANAAWSTFMPNFAVERNQLTAGPFFTAFALALTLSRVFLGAVSDRWGRRLVVLPGLAGQALALCMVSVMSNWGWMIAAGLVAGAGLGAARAALEAATVESAHEGRRGQAINTVWLGFDVGITFGAVAWGALATELGYGAMFGVVGSLSFVVVALFTVLYRES